MDFGFLTVDLHHGGNGIRAAILLGCGHLLANPLQRSDRRQVLLGEDVPDLLRVHLTTLAVGDPLDRLREFDLQTARQHQSVIGLHDVGDAALAGLRVHPDHGLVVAADVLGVDGQVRHLPQDVVDVGICLVRIAFHLIQALVDGVLVAAGEGGVDQIATVRVPLGNLQLVAVLDRMPDLVDVGEIDLWVHPSAEQVQPQRHQAHVPGALAVAEQTSLDTVGACLVTQLCCGDGGSAIVVWVQAQDHRVATSQVAAHPLDGIGVHIGGCHLHRRRQIEDDRVVRCGLDDVADGVAHLQRVLQLGAGVRLRGVLETPMRIGVFGRFLNTLAGTIGGDLLDRVLLAPKNHAPLQDRRRVVEVHDHPRGALAGQERAFDQLRSALGQHLDGHVIGDGVLADQLADEIEIGLAGRGKPDLDFLEAHPDLHIEHPALTRGTHRVDQGLVAVTQVDRRPLWCTGDHLVGPGAVEGCSRFAPWNFQGERSVPMYRHRAVLLGVPRRLVGRNGPIRGDDAAGGVVELV